MSLLGRMRDLPERERDERPARSASLSPAQEQQQARLREVKRRIQRRLTEETRGTRARKTRSKEKAREQERIPQSEGEQKLQMALQARRQQQEIEELRNRIRELFNQYLAEERIPLTRKEQQQTLEMIVADILGFGPLEKLLEDDSTTDIMVVGPERVYVERKGRIYRTAVAFDDDEHLHHIIDRIIAPLGRRVDELSPMVDARLPDGSRVNVVIPPLAIGGACLTIRKFSATPLRLADLVANDTASPDVLEFLQAAVIAQLNILVSGGSGTGKTTLLNVLSGAIPDAERIVTIENAAELQLQQAHVIRLETRPANVEGEGEMTIRELVINSLRMRPDRIIVGEVRGGEAIDLLQAMNTGHEGSMGTIHANSPSDALARLETMCLMAKMNLPSRAVREQIAAAIDLVVHMVQTRDGVRRIVQVSEVEGMEGDTIMVSDLFSWEQLGFEPDGRIRGVMRASGIIPRSIDRIKDAGLYLPPSLFGVSTFATERPRLMKEFRRAEEPSVVEPPPDVEPSSDAGPPPDAGPVG